MFIGICKDINGGFAEYIVAHKSQVYPVPEGVSPESAALTEPLSVGLQVVLTTGRKIRTRCWLSVAASSRHGC